METALIQQVKFDDNLDGMDVRISDNCYVYVRRIDGGFILNIAVNGEFEEKVVKPYAPCIYDPSK